MTSDSTASGTPGTARAPATGMDPMAAFAELGRIDLASTDLRGALQKVAELAKRAIPAAAEVSVTLMAAGVAGTAASTGALALALDERQYDAGYGPCLDAALHQTVNLIKDLAQEARWPAYVAGAREQGVGSSLSVGIPIREAVTGGLNIYALAAGSFDQDSVTAAQTFASYGAVALANAHLYEATAALAAQMGDAMASRAVIEQAKGIVMAQQNVGPAEAFEILARASQVGNRKLRDIAQAMVDGVAT
jgi:GAF domain-containing protein